MKCQYEESLIKAEWLPFTQEIRDFVSTFLKRNEKKINQIFTRVQGNWIIDDDDFPAFVESFTHNSNELIDTFEGMLEYCTTLCQITLQVYRNGATLAPSIALVKISETVKAYISTGVQSENTIWLRLGMKPQLSTEQPNACSAEAETANIHSARGDKLQMLFNHLEKQIKKVVTV
ncbi:hypothetical protein TNCT_289441 [Trichonephila clavata]|uniref:Uncharacterized protein n=1 Tax=Trichonephila clavata TaxID=2740835 RepID=A0A8X6LWA4_TRICU|nr:hypothetical protein TNCT_289441 [Trichonephila clavata]